MRLTRLSFADDPQRLTWEPYDCIWIRLAGRKEPAPLRGTALQWVDWKLQGTISRYLFDGGYQNKMVTFIPAAKKLGSPLLAIENGSGTDWQSFFTNSEGMRLAHILYVCEEQSQVDEWKKALSDQPAKDYPQSVTFAVDLSGREVREQ